MVTSGRLIVHAPVQADVKRLTGELSNSAAQLNASAATAAAERATAAKEMHAHLKAASEATAAHNAAIARLDQQLRDAAGDSGAALAALQVCHARTKNVGKYQSCMAHGSWR